MRVPLIVAGILCLALAVTANDIVIRQVKEGNCYLRSKQGDTVRFFQQASVPRTGEIFDSNIGKLPHEMVLSEGFLSQALSNMCMGEQRKIIVQPKVAAGMKQQGIGGDVPLNEVLEFFLEMAQIMPANAIEVEVLVSKENCVRSKQGDTVAFFQLAKVARTGHVFESNFGKEVFIRKLGVTALDQALLNMCAGERRAILVMPQAIPHMMDDFAGVPKGEEISFELELDAINPENVKTEL